MIAQGNYVDATHVFEIGSDTYAYILLVTYHLEKEPITVIDTQTPDMQAIDAALQILASAITSIRTDLLAMKSNINVIAQNTDTELL